MAKRLSKLAGTLKQLGEIQVTEWDFMSLLNKDIRDIEFSRSLRKLGNIQVMEWDFRTVMPAVSRLANQHVDLADLVRRTANYKVLEWDFKSASPQENNPTFLSPKPAKTSPNREDIQTIIERLKKFLQYVAVSLIDEPNHAQIKIQEIAPNVFRFKLVLVNRDVAMLIGREGHTATAIRNMLKAEAERHGIHALLQIHSHEEEMALPNGGSS